MDTRSSEIQQQGHTQSRNTAARTHAVQKYSSKHMRSSDNTAAKTDAVQALWQQRHKQYRHPAGKDTSSTDTTAARTQAA